MAEALASSAGSAPSSAAPAPAAPSGGGSVGAAPNKAAAAPAAGERAPTIAKSTGDVMGAGEDEDDQYLDQAVDAAEAAEARAEDRLGGGDGEGGDEEAAQLVETEEEPSAEDEKAEARLILAGYTRKQIKALKTDPDAFRALAERHGSDGAERKTEQNGQQQQQQQAKAPLKARIGELVNKMKRYGDDFTPVAEGLTSVVDEIDTMRGELTKQLDMTRQLVDGFYGQFEERVLLPNQRGALTKTYGRLDDTAWNRVMATAKVLAKTGKYSSIDELIPAAAAKVLKPRQNPAAQLGGQMTSANRNPRGGKPAQTDPDDEYLDKALGKRA